MEIVREEHFGTIERIREWKNESGITWEQFADLVGVSYKGVKRWTNKKAPTPIRSKNLAKIAGVMNCDVEYLECKQNEPRRSAGHKIRLSSLSLADRYLPKIQALMEGTNYRFTYKYDLSETQGEAEEIEGSFIDGETKYYYRDIERSSSIGSVNYMISVNGSEEVRISEDEMEIFVKGVLKYISKEITDLEEGTKVYPNVIKEMNRLNLTVAELSERAEIDNQALEEALRGEKTLLFGEAVRIKKALGSELSMEDLFLSVKK